MVLSSFSLYKDKESDFNNDNGNDIYNDDQQDAMEIFHFCISSNKVKLTYFLQRNSLFFKTWKQRSKFNLAGAKVKIR